jgi:hypothetical protein
MVTGSVAAAVYGDPRLTRDVDVVLEIRKGDPERLPCGSWSSTVRVAQTATSATSGPCWR